MVRWMGIGQRSEQCWRFGDYRCGEHVPRCFKRPNKKMPSGDIPAFCGEYPTALPSGGGAHGDDCCAKGPHCFYKRREP